LFVTTLAAGGLSAQTFAADWDWLEEQKKKLLDDVYEGTKKVIVDEAPQPAVEAPPAAEVEAQPPAANPPKIEQQPAQVQAQPQTGDTPRFDKPWVTEIQTHLTSLGYNPGSIDGAFGNKSQSAITAFQQYRGDPVTGLPTPSVMQALRIDTQAVTVVSAPEVVADPPPLESARLAKIAKADLDKGAFPLAPYLPNNLAHSDAVVAVCGDARDPLMRENAVAMIEVWQPDHNDTFVQNYDKIFGIFVKSFTKNDRCFDRDTNTTTAAEAYTEFIRYQDQVLALSADLKAGTTAAASVTSRTETTTATPAATGSSAPTPEVAAAPPPTPTPEQPAPIASAEDQAAQIEALTTTDFNNDEADKMESTTLAFVDLHIENCRGYREIIRENFATYMEYLPDYAQGWAKLHLTLYDQTYENYKSRHLTYIGKSTFPRNDCSDEVVAKMYAEYDKWKVSKLGPSPSSVAAAKKEAFLADPATANEIYTAQQFGKQAAVVRAWTEVCDDPSGAIYRQDSYAKIDAVYPDRHTAFVESYDISYAEMKQKLGSLASTPTPNTCFSRIRSEKKRYLHIVRADKLLRDHPTDPAITRVGLGPLVSRDYLRTAPRYLAWTDTCDDPVASGVRRELFARLDEVYFGEIKAGVIQAFDKSYDEMTGKIGTAMANSGDPQFCATGALESGDTFADDKSRYEDSLRSLDPAP
jgi:peptidoglycan hydrolase-like protein with peptidoglycan-binding domain